MTPVLVDVEGALTTFANPASLATDAGTSTLVDGSDDENVAAAAGITKIDPTTAATVGANACRDDEDSESAFSLTHFFLRGRLPSPIGLETT